MSVLRTVLAASALAAGLMLPAVSSAAACSAFDLTSVNSNYDSLYPGSPGDLDTADVTFRGSPADACAGLYHGNNVGNATSIAQVQALIANMGWGTDYSSAITSNGGGTAGGEAHGIEWTVSYDDGTWRLAYSADPDATIQLDVVAIFKQSQGWAAWWFDDESFVTDGSGNGTYEIEWCSGNPSAQPNRGWFDCSGTDLSHLSVYFGDPQTLDQCTNGECGQTPVPGSLALLGIGLAGLGYRFRRSSL